MCVWLLAVYTLFICSSILSLVWGEKNNWSLIVWKRTDFIWGCSFVTGTSQRCFPNLKAGICCFLRLRKKAIPAPYTIWTFQYVKGFCLFHCCSVDSTSSLSYCQVCGVVCFEQYWLLCKTVKHFNTSLWCPFSGGKYQHMESNHS